VQLDLRLGFGVRAGREIEFEMTIDVHMIARVTALRRGRIVVSHNAGIRSRNVGLPGLAIGDKRGVESAVKIDNLDWLGTASRCRAYQNHV
jgi:hypothetical protein